jgi:putative ABC transport system ATP-binding protein
MSPYALTAVRHEKVGLIFQQFHLIPYLTALENVGLRERAKHLPRHISGGE